MWDRYLENSLKQGTREARGTGTRRRVCDNAAIPLNWKSFVRLNDNKKELFQYLAAGVQSLGISDVEVISTADVDVITSSTIDKAGLAPCNPEEADTRIFVHARHASLNGMKKILIRTVDTDVVILAIAFAKKLEVEGLWVAFGVGKHLRYLPIQARLPALLPPNNVKVYRSSMHLLGAIQCHFFFLERVRRPHFKHGSAILR